MFTYKNISQVARIIFATQCSFTDHLKRKIVNKATCRVPFFNCYDYFLRHLGFLDLFGKVFLTNVKFSKPDCGSNVNKTF